MFLIYFLIKNYSTCCLFWAIHNLSPRTMYMMSTKKTALEKFQHPAHPVLKTMDSDNGWMQAGGILLIPTPAIMDQTVKHIPYGQESSLQELRQQLAHTYKADVTCPMTASIFLRLAVEAALERGDIEQLPFWRVLPKNHKIIQKNHLEDLWHEKRSEEKIDTI